MKPIAPSNPRVDKHDTGCDAQGINPCDDGADCGDDEHCGGEQAPSKEGKLFGLDYVALQPIGLAFGVAFSAAVVLTVQIPLFCNAFAWSMVIPYVLTLLEYTTTVGCIMWCMFCDPGQMPEETVALLTVDEDGNPELPKRAKKNWMYSQPILRYDHYCKWLANAIGFRNHRSFAVMLMGLLTMGVFGFFVDLAIIWHYGRYTDYLQQHPFLTILVLMHTVTAFGLTHKAQSLVKIHVGLIGRSELADEWKNHKHCVVNKDGDIVRAEDLDAEEYNEFFDNDLFYYDPVYNTFDKGWKANCLSFWTMPRTVDSTSEF